MPSPLPSPRVVLTGARGCLGGVLGRHLESRGYAVARVSRTGGPGIIGLEPFLAAPATGDPILHLAWSSLPSTAERQPGIEEREDLPLLRRLLEAQARAPRPAHFVFFSSGGTVYGNAAGDRPHREEDPCAPIGRHGRAKLAAEQLIRDLAPRLGLDWTILRVSNPYGFAIPASHPQGIIPVAIEAARSGRPLTLWGDGTARKDFLFHEDFGDAIDRVVDGRLTGVFNVAYGSSYSVADVLRLVEAAVGRPIERRHIPAHPWDVHNSLLDNARFRASAGWTPAVGLAEGIRRMVSGR
ncbi:MAG TPA: NAD-dependent epimerase/dehydratase family protein [Opitutaceae bacterium]|nr:NAD-dependent epimerase/dehydratase family protein [Opitutaceae bacterium]